MWKQHQKIISRAEPELGLGNILQVEGNAYVEVCFPNSGEVRRYSTNGAPLKRFKLRLGQTASFRGGINGEITEIVENDHGLIIYTCDGHLIPETDLENVVEDQGAIDQFFENSLSHHQTYELRKEAWRLKSAGQQSELLGMVGARVTPLPHQLYIASEVSKRHSPRVLLSDEVGLGKTIEAGLIFRSLQAKDRANRVLILAPESLVHQWVAEMFRKFNQIFSVIDAERCEQEFLSLGISAFQANQLNITSIDFLLSNPEQLAEALKVDWDLLIVDEAHHLIWNQVNPCKKWQITKSLSYQSQGLLLLTATPQQNGVETQFGLLHLVDPERFSDFDSFVDEHKSLQNVAKIAQEIHDNGLNPKITEQLQKLFKDDEALIQELNDPNTKANGVLKSLIDRHGTGRVLFRNRRERLKGFPKRTLYSVPIDKPEDYQNNLQAIANDLNDELAFSIACGNTPKDLKLFNETKNPKSQWLLNFANTDLANKKALILLSTSDQVLELQKFLTAAPRLKVALFHEQMSVVERDKQAAHFAEADGAQILICSEIGGEGRNFQFADHLILMDIPKHPDLLEQRIGRLDRIGQGKEIHIYVPWIKDSAEEVLFQWYHQGLNAFESSWNGASTLYDEFKADLLSTFREVQAAEKKLKIEAILADLISKTKASCVLLQQYNRESVDLLVDLNSYDPKIGEEKLESVYDCDDDPSIECFMVNMFDHYGIDYEEFDDRGSLLIKPESLAFIEKFPGINSNEESVITFDRDIALAREDIGFLTHDHPIVEGSMSLLLDRNEGVASICKWRNSPAEGAIIELNFVLETSGPKHLELGRYLPVKTRELAYDHKGRKNREKRYKDEPLLLLPLEEGEFPKNEQELKSVLEPILARAFDKATQWAEEITDKAIEKADRDLSSELSRLKALAAVNPTITKAEVTRSSENKDNILKLLKSTTPRLDGIRVILCW